MRDDLPLYPLLPDQWVSVRRLAEAEGETTAKIYAALYNPDRPMPCSRNGRAIRVRLRDWRDYWTTRTTTIKSSPKVCPTCGCRGCAT